MLSSQRPLGRIALALSGGGYRAAAYHLGTFQVLDRLGLLKDVTILSTASGGSIVGARYVQSLLKGESFAEFVASTSEFLTNVNVIAEALDRVADESDGRDPSLIRSAAAIYAERLFGNVRWGEILASDSHLREIVINATEFENGLAFRFQRSDDPQAAFGNQRLRLSQEQARDIRLADSVAASSCFPGAFEPMIFPRDFSWVRAAPKVDDVALMDGGIYDNQAIEAARLADHRSDERVGLIVISDTDRRDSDFLEIAAPDTKRGWLRLWHVRVLSWVLFLLSLATAVVNVRALVDYLEAEQYFAALAAAGGVLVPLGIACALLWLRGVLGSLVRRIPFPGFDLWPAIRKLSVLEVIGLVERRANSLVALTAGVFTKRVRALVFKTLFATSSREKIVTSLIYSLDERGEKAPAPGLEPPSAEMREIASAARATETTLWFSPDMPLDKLVACGRFTLCAKLVSTLMESEADAADSSSARQEILRAASSLWQELVRDPLAWTDRRNKVGLAAE